MMIQVLSDMMSRTVATVRVTASPWVHTWTRPEEAKFESMGIVVRRLLGMEIGGPSPGDQSSTQLIGTRYHIASGTPARLPGTKRQRRTASTAALSSRLKPLEVAT